MPQPQPSPPLKAASPQPAPPTSPPEPPPEVDVGVECDAQEEWNILHMRLVETRLIRAHEVLVSYDKTKRGGAEGERNGGRARGDEEAADGPEQQQQQHQQ